MAMKRADVLRWIEGFEAAAAVDREALRHRRPDSAWSIRLSLSLIAAAEHAGWRQSAAGDAREADAEPVRQAWAVLRRRLGR